MFKNSVLGILLCILSLKGFSQQSDKLSFGSGSVIDKAFKVRGRTPVFNSFPSYFFKLEYNGKSWSKRKWSIFMTMGISYMYLTNNYSPFSTTGYLDKLTVVTYDNLNIYFGPQALFQYKKTRSGLGILLNNLLNIHSETNTRTLSSGTIYYSSNNFTGFGAYISLQSFCMYRLAKKIWIGPSCDVFFCDMNYTVSELEQRGNNSNYHKGNVFGINGSSVWINPGLKLQLDLK